MTKTVLITGASSGFGADLAKRLLKEYNYNIILADINTKSGIELQQQIDPNNEKTIFVNVDVTNTTQMKELFKRGVDKFGSIEVVVNNAGIAEKVPFHEDYKDSWEMVLDIDLRACILGTRLAITEMYRHKNGGVIVNTASLAGLYPQPTQPIYAAAKGGLVHFTRSLTNLNDGIRVNCVCPSFSPTPLLQGISPNLDLRDSGMELVPVSTVTDAFIKAIHDESLNGACIRVTPQYGIDLYNFRRSKSSRL